MKSSIWLIDVNRFKTWNFCFFSFGTYNVNFTERVVLIVLTQEERVKASLKQLRQYSGIEGWVNSSPFQRAPPKPQFLRPFLRPQFLFWTCLRAVFASVKRHKFFEQTLFFVRWLIFVHWMILDKIIYSLISMMVSYSSFFRCCSFADAARFHTVRVVAKMHTVIWNAFVKQRSKQDELRLSFVSFWHPTVVKFLLMFWSLLSVTSWASLRHQECLILSLRWSPYRLLHRQTGMKIKDYMCLNGWTAQIDETKHETDWLVSFRTKTDRATPGHRASLYVWTDKTTILKSCCKLVRIA